MAPSGAFSTALWFPPIPAAPDGLVLRGQAFTGTGAGDLSLGGHVTAVVPDVAL